MRRRARAFRALTSITVVVLVASTSGCASRSTSRTIEPATLIERWPDLRGHQVRFHLREGSSPVTLLVDELEYPWVIGRRIVAGSTISPVQMHIDLKSVQRIEITEARRSEGPTPGGDAASTYWRIPSAIGYGGLAGGIALLLVVSQTNTEPEDVRYIPLAAAVGILVGYRIGAAADRSLARGDSLSNRHRWAIRTGTALSGGTIGVIVGGFMIATDEDDRSMSDEKLIAAAVGLGLVSGTLLQMLIDSHLSPSEDVSVSVAPTDEGGIGAGLRWEW